MKTLVVSTRNNGKIREIRALLESLVENVICAADVAGFSDTVEDGETFEANALKKAREAMRFTGLPSLADDSGLVVEALDGAPGVYSARFAGEGCGDAANNARLLMDLKQIRTGNRKASFICVLAFVTPDGGEHIFEGRVGGAILDAPQGSDGFGYDPLFLVDGHDRTMAELPLEEKNRISHRGQAFRQLREFLLIQGKHL